MKSSELKAEILDLGRRQFERYNEAAQINNEVRLLLMRLEKLAVAQEMSHDRITGLESKFIGVYNDEFPREPIPDGSFAEILHDDTSISTDGDFEATLPILPEKRVETLLAHAWKEFLK